MLSVCREQYAIRREPILPLRQTELRYFQKTDKKPWADTTGQGNKHHRSPYFKWTQWIFIQIFNTWFDEKLRMEDLLMN
jgi:leucyl-tRNA synthetase